MNESNNQTIKIPTEDGDDDESSSFDLISADIQAFVPRSTSNNSLGTLNNSWTHVTDSGDVISLRHSNSSSNSSSIEVSDRSTTVEASIVSPLSCHQAEDDVSPLRTHVHSPDDVSDESDLPLVQAALDHVKAGESNAVFIEAPAKREPPAMLREYEGAKAGDIADNKLIQSGVFPYKFVIFKLFATFTDR